MPTYSYVCGGCGHCFEKFLKVDDRDEPVESPCPNCSESKVTKQFGINPVLDPYRMGLIKPPESFRDLLRQIKHRNSGSVLDIN